jgi:hypothetical protein
MQKNKNQYRKKRNPLDLGSRYQSPPDLTAKDMQQPIINIQNAPAAPDPTGIGAMSGLLATQNLFKDLTGLEGTQKIALEGMLGNQQAALGYAGMASKLAAIGYMGEMIKKSGLPKADQDKYMKDLLGNLSFDATNGGDKNGTNPPNPYDHITKLGAGGGGKFYPNGTPSELHNGTNTPPSGSSPLTLPKQIRGTGGAASTWIDNPSYLQYAANPDYTAVDNGNGTVTFVPNGESGTKFPSIGFKIGQYALGGVFDGSVSFTDFIQIVRDIEAEFTTTDAKNTKKMLTQLRKSYPAYSAGKWDSHVIKGAAGVAVTVSITNQNRLAAAQLVTLPDGVLTDIGHLFTGADAGNYPAEVNPLYLWLSIDSNIDAATWLGDLGSVLSHLYLHPSFAESDWQQAIDTYSSSSDLIGDIDGAILARMFNYSIHSTTTKVSDLLESYYNSVHYSSKARFQLFTQSVGLIGFHNSTFSFTNEEQWLDKYAPQVSDFAALFALGASWTASSFTISPFLSHAASKHLLRAFLNTIKGGLL